MTDVEYKVEKITDGIGFGMNSAAAYELREANAGHEAVDAAKEAIVSGNILVSVDQTTETGHPVDDDGCGDGRGVKRIFQGIIEKTRSLRRPKVFGGGSTMAVASFIGLGKAESMSLRDTFHAGISHLRERLINFGAHVDDEAKDGDSGCGAIDRAPEAIEAIVRYKDGIKAVVSTLGQDTTGIETVFSNFAAMHERTKDENYHGQDVMEEIVDDGKIVKELEGPHKELFIIINEITGHTVDQGLIRDVSGDAVQAFSVDLWRLKELAEEMFDDPEEQRLALLSELVYTLGVASVLTNGDLPVYVVSPVLHLAA